MTPQKIMLYMNVLIESPLSIQALLILYQEFLFKMLENHNIVNTWVPVKLFCKYFHSNVTSETSLIELGVLYDSVEHNAWLN